MADDQIVQVIYGPFRDQRLTLASADAAAAISEGWAYDPQTYDPLAPKEELTLEEQGDAIRAANHAAAVLRGETPPDEVQPEEPPARKPSKAEHDEPKHEPSRRK